MPLSDVKIRAAKPGDKPKKLGDSGGLFLLVQPSGGKLWRFKYRFDGKEKKLSFGRYPDVSLQETRKRRDEARVILANGSDPTEARKDAEREAIERSANSFEHVAEEYLEKIAAEGREAVTIKKSRWLLSLLIPTIGAMPISEIKPAQLLAALKTVEAKGHYETAMGLNNHL
ncbi:tyrosine-type recombinase/integrase [Porphyrobacter sp. AAP60]|uniref:tyrosine-type recombinase/integrase n=1 Tax=Porphyrobacter sp. AAP60 TaxID=1523423 RepID=UPI0006B9AB44|nr:integrase arm-type DNA-binding domain-containing protein [Porphyrobacter sp. AAP60]